MICFKIAHSLISRKIIGNRTDIPRSAKQPHRKCLSETASAPCLPPRNPPHAISGCSLVHTTVETAQAGCMSRRLMKYLEGLPASRDYTLLRSSSGLIQLKDGVTIWIPSLWRENAAQDKGVKQHSSDRWRYCSWAP